jgi:MFS family permease
MKKKLAGFRPVIAIRDRCTSLRLLGVRLARRTAQSAWQFTAGGSWTQQLRPPIRHNLRSFWFDGLFAASSNEVLLAYLTLFLLALDATPAQIGLMSSLSSLGAAAMLLPGAALVERWGQRKRIVVLTGGGAARVALMLTPLVPLLFTGPMAIYAVIALAVARDAFSQLGMPAWTSLTADIVPLKWRGRFFASRNIVVGLVKIPFIYLVGLLITRLSSPGNPTGYQLALGLSFLLGVAATVSYVSIRESTASPVQTRGGISWTAFLQHLRARPEFLAFCATAALWNLSIMIAGPFFNVYLVESLRATPAIVGILSTISTLAALLGQRLFGTMADRWGAQRVQLVTGLIIPLLPWSWALTRSPWHVVPIDVAGGFLWAGYNLANFNMLLTITPEDLRPRYSALYQIVVMIALAIGSAIGSIILEQWGYYVLFILSGIGRLAAALLFASQGRRFDHQPVATGDATGD